MYHTALAAQTSEWWDSLSPSKKKSYLQRHPKSKYGSGGSGNAAPKKASKFKEKNAELKDTVAKMEPKQRRKLKSAVDDTFVPEKRGGLSPFANSVNKAFGDIKSFVSKLGRKTTKAIADPIREGIANRTNPEAIKNASKAVGKLLVKAGLIGVGVAGAASLGMPVEIFVPRIMENVWQRLDNTMGRAADVHLVGNLVDAIKSQAKEEPREEDVEDSLYSPKPKNEGISGKGGKQ